MASAKHSSISIWDRTSARLVLAAGIMLLLHLPLIFLQAPGRQDARICARGNAGSVVALPASARDASCPVLRDLFAWAEIADCSTSYQRNLKEGYQQFVPPLPRRSTPPFPELVLAQLSSPAFSISPVTVHMQESPAEQLVLQSWPDFLPPPPRSVPVFWEDGIYWRSYGRGPLKNPPVIDAVELKEVLAGADLKKLTGTTVLEIILQPELRIPRVIVRSSCGIPGLDMLASRTIRRQLENAMKHRPDLRRSAEKLSCRIQTDWRLPLKK